MLPFTHAQFVAVFAAYNTAVWPAQLAAYALGGALLWLVARPARQSGRWATLGLSVLWLWTGVGYHWLYFAAINKAAWAFGAIFVVGAVLLAAAAFQDHLRFAPATGPVAALGWVLLAYAMLAYPLLGLMAGMRYSLHAHVRHHALPAHDLHLGNIAAGAAGTALAPGGRAIAVVGDRRQRGAAAGCAAGLATAGQRPHGLAAAAAPAACQHKRAGIRAAEHGLPLRGA